MSADEEKNNLLRTIGDNHQLLVGTASRITDKHRSLVAKETPPAGIDPDVYRKFQRICIALSSTNGLKTKTGTEYDPEKKIVKNGDKLASIEEIRDLKLKLANSLTVAADFVKWAEAKVAQHDTTLLDSDTEIETTSPKSKPDATSTTAAAPAASSASTTAAAKKQGTATNPSQINILQHLSNSLEQNHPMKVVEGIRKITDPDNKLKQLNQPLDITVPLVAAFDAEAEMMKITVLPLDLITKKTGVGLDKSQKIDDEAAKVDVETSTAHQLLRFFGFEPGRNPNAQLKVKAPLLSEIATRFSGIDSLFSALLAIAAVAELCSDTGEFARDFVCLCDAWPTSLNFVICNKAITTAINLLPTCDRVRRSNCVIVAYGLVETTPTEVVFDNIGADDEMNRIANEAGIAVLKKVASSSDEQIKTTTTLTFAHALSIGNFIYKNKDGERAAAKLGIVAMTALDRAVMKKGVSDGNGVIITFGMDDPAEAAAVIRATAASAKIEGVSNSAGKIEEAAKAGLMIEPAKKVEKTSIAGEEEKEEKMQEGQKLEEIVVSRNKKQLLTVRLSSEFASAANSALSPLLISSVLIKGLASLEKKEMATPLMIATAFRNHRKSKTSPMDSFEIVVSSLKAAAMSMPSISVISAFAHASAASNHRLFRGLPTMARLMTPHSTSKSVLRLAVPFGKNQIGFSGFLSSVNHFNTTVKADKEWCRRALSLIPVEMEMPINPSTPLENLADIDPLLAGEKAREWTPEVSSIIKSAMSSNPSAGIQIALTARVSLSSLHAMFNKSKLKPGELIRDDKTEEDEPANQIESKKVGIPICVGMTASIVGATASQLRGKRRYASAVETINSSALIVAGTVKNNLPGTALTTLVKRPGPMSTTEGQLNSVFKFVDFHGVFKMMAENNSTF